ncbi:uncharacterized protein TNCV_503001 [Trichonephila clavipes]|nr:uncharacterized protein TNCV_503001 [Trichonephila clavipes]
MRHPFRWATRGFLATDHVILNHGQVTWTTPELALPLLTTTPHQREDVSALPRASLPYTAGHGSGTGLEPVTKQATVRYLYHSATAAIGVSPNQPVTWTLRIHSSEFPLYNSRHFHSYKCIMEWTAVKRGGSLP